MWDQVKGTLAINEGEETFEELTNIASDGLDSDKRKPKERIEYRCKWGRGVIAEEQISVHTTTHKVIAWIT